MKNFAIPALFALSLSAQLIAQDPVAVSPNSDDKVTLVGCVIKGDGGYVLSSTTDPYSTAPGSAANTVTSASSVAGRTFYWLSDDGDLNDHAGRKVEVVGKLENEIDKGKISVEQEGGMTEIEFKADGERKITIKVPNEPATVGTSGAVTDHEKDHKVVIRKIDVKSVKVLASTCQ